MCAIQAIRADTRLRPSILLRYGGYSVVVDTTPDFSRPRCCRPGVARLDANSVYATRMPIIFWGLDDVRALLITRQARPESRFTATPKRWRTIQARIPLCVSIPSRTESSVPKLGPACDQRRAFRGCSAWSSYRFAWAAWGAAPPSAIVLAKPRILRDHSDIPESSKGSLHNLDVLFLDALRHRSASNPYHGRAGAGIGGGN